MAPKTTLAGGCEIDDRLFSDSTPAADRSTLAPEDVAAWLARNGAFRCEAFAATMRPEQCALNREQGNFTCGKCTQERPAVPGAPEIKRRGRKRAEPPPGCQWIGRHLVGPCPSCKRPGMTLSNGKVCFRCQDRTARGVDVMAPNRGKKSREEL